MKILAKRKITAQFFGLLFFSTAFLVPVPGSVFAQSQIPFHVYELPLGEGHRNGHFLEHARELGQQGRQGSHRSIHIARIVPGQAYRLGLALRSSQSQKLTVSLYDRWPDAKDAKQIRLQTGAGFRGMQGYQEYQWWFSVDKDSTGSLLYASVVVEPRFASGKQDWRYQVFLLESPPSPMNTLGRGVVYNRGPANIKLQENRPSVEFRYRMYSRHNQVYTVNEIDEWPGNDSGGLSETNLIENGDFSSGLSAWRLHPDGSEGVGIFNEKLRIWSNESVDEYGITQQLNAQITGSDSMVLTMDIMISKQTEPYRPGGTSPLMLVICYEDQQGVSYCGENSFRKYFSIELDKQPDHSSEVVYLPIKRWSRYSLDLRELNPRPSEITSIGIMGRGAPERDAWVRMINIY